MSLQTNYERDDAHSAIEVAANWRAVYTSLVTDMNCCGPNKPQNNYNTYIEYTNIKLIMLQLYQMYVAASLDVQVAFPDVPDLFDSDPGDVGAEVSDRNLALCIACKSWVDTMCNGGQSFLVGAIDDILPIAVGAIAIPIIPVPISLFIGLGVALYGATAYTELGREDYRDYLACGMYTALRGGDTTTQTAFDAAFDNLPVRPPPPETGAQDQVRDLIEAWFRAVVNDLENYLAFVSVLGAAMTAAPTIDPLLCSCITCSPLQFLMDAALDPELHFHGDPAVPGAIPMPGNGVGGNWGITFGETAGGVRSTATGVTDHINYVLYIEVSPLCPVTWVQFRKRYENSGANRGHSMTFYDAAGTLLHTAYNKLHNASSDWQTQTSGAISVAGCSWVRIHEESRLINDAWVECDTIDITQ